MNARISGQSPVRNRIFAQFQRISPQDIYSLWRGKIVTLHWRILEVIKVSITTKTHQCHITMLWCPEEVNISSAMFLTNMYNLNLVMRNHQIKPNWRTVWKIIDQYSSEVSGSWKMKKDWATVTDWRRWGRQNNKIHITQDGIPDRKGTEDMWWNLSKVCKLGGSILSKLIFSFRSLPWFIVWVIA